MTVLETNEHLESLEIHRVNFAKKSCQTLSASIALRTTKCVLNELNIIDCHLDRSLLLLLAPAFNLLQLRRVRIINCFLNNKVYIYIFMYMCIFVYLMYVCVFFSIHSLPFFLFFYFFKKKGCQTLCNALEESKQYATLNHINMSKNHFGSSGSKALASLIEKCGSLFRLVMMQCDLDGNEFIPALNTRPNSGKDHHQNLALWDTLTYLDLSNNSIGDKGSTALGVFLENSRVINLVKLSNCSLSPIQLQRIFRGAMVNQNGFNVKDQLFGTTSSTTTTTSTTSTNTASSNSDPVSPLQKPTSPSNSQSLPGGAFGVIASPSSPTSASSSLSTTTVSSVTGAGAGATSPFSSFTFLPTKRPTQDEILFASNLLSLSLDLSENNLGGKGVDVLVQELVARENYTIVSLNLAKNNLNVAELSQVIRSLTNLACLERLCVSENVKKGSFGKNADSKGDIGSALSLLCRNVPTLNEIAITGNDKQSYCIDIGLLPFVETLPYLSNLEFIDISGNKWGQYNNGALWKTWLEMVSKNRNLHVIKFFGNKISTEQIYNTLEVLACHTSVFEKLPKLELKQLLQKNAKKQSEIEDLIEQVKKQFKENRIQYEMDQQMINALPIEFRVEKELRRQVGCQFGIPIERIRGTIRFPDYQSRIPQILVRLRDCLKAKDGLKQEGIFRLQPDAKKFDHTKLMLDSNVFENDMHHNCVANAIKVWYRDLPIKVLHTVPLERIEKSSAVEDAADVIAKCLTEPHKSVFEWLLDLAVEVCEHKDINRMDAKNMAVVLSPNLYDTSLLPTTQALVFSQSLLKFTEAAIKWRIEFRKTHPYRPPDDMPSLKAGITVVREKTLSPNLGRGGNDDDDDDDDEDDDEDRRYVEQEDEKSRDPDKSESDDTSKQDTTKASQTNEQRLSNTSNNTHSSEQEHADKKLTLTSTTSNPSEQKDSDTRDARLTIDIVIKAIQKQNFFFF
ncbi:RhoGAP domain-containing protein [Reticulomyxa filosa]|uniref:RhoGAP domain-containing protein n=1 Tax=Reticulomyxa filosa TaxID=46433 RepID=X6MKS4_RETFI|nr:RhoGAP domain-containing protein [Reticulomyxa filosa]|eukprot:ETO14434.1 RhoGAP domain-containing protein [Reticulomyxa filosa]